MEIGLEHAVQRWVLAGLQDLITRDIPLTQSEALWIDATTFNKVARAREHRLQVTHNAPRDGRSETSRL